jgi:hypothetical protein
MLAASPEGSTAVVKFYFPDSRRQHRARQRHPPAIVRVSLAAPQTHIPVPCLWAHGELTSCYSPHRPTTTLDSRLWTLAPHAAPWTADRCEREDWEVPATTGLLGPLAWKYTGATGGDIASRVSGNTVESGGPIARPHRDLFVATDILQLAFIQAHQNSEYDQEQ